ncbi:hypothetical protein [Streptomyces sp. SPB162]|uniref:hypothetical protein n=1 Tax=Streptomyces sp. SPB162 TaxID=2940560 RepID=UPI002405F4E5|nr:hypothetical protein [Streptomyces sp. SPB162]MDF9814089.1 hypothetical protein [Streptomyces sp. SPB162]
MHLPVSEDGPVTLELPVRRAGVDGVARALLTYGACSERFGCSAPVRDRAVELRLP